MNSIAKHLQSGVRNKTGTYKFEKDEIISFARKYDPQYFHTDEEAAQNSLFGGLCASGWHTIAIWMKMQRAFTADKLKQYEAEGLPIPEFGPSPGIRELKWLKPVYAGDAITYFTETTNIRQSNSKPGWSITTQINSAYNQNDEQVLSFIGTVFIKLPQ